jgi:Sec-independent protein translocase protein TatA
MASKYQRSRRQKKGVRRKKAGTPLSGLEILRQLGHQIDDRWPNLGPRIASIVRASREKLDDIYSSAGRAIAEHKEAFEDRLAERKAAAEASIQKSAQQDSAARPSRGHGRETVSDTRVEGSGADIPHRGAEARRDQTPES